MSVFHRSGVSLPGSARNKHGAKNTRDCCKNVLRRSAVSLPYSARNTYGFKNTPEGVAIMCCTDLLFSSTGGARSTQGIKNTPEGVARISCIGLVFFTRQCKEQTRR